MAKRRKKSRLRFSEDDYYKTKGITREEAEDSDFYPCIFKPRWALLPMMLGIGIFIWQLCFLPPLEYYWQPISGFFCLFFLCVMGYFEKNSKHLLQWFYSLLGLLAIFITPYCLSFLLLFILVVWLLWPWGFAATLKDKGYPKIGIIVGVLIFSAGTAAFYLFGWDITQRAYHTIIFPYTGNSIQKIIFERKDHAPLVISEPAETEKIVSAWKTYLFDAGHGRWLPPYDIDAHEPWQCRVIYRSGEEKNYIVASGLRRTSDSVCVIDTTQRRKFDLCPWKHAYQSPELYRVLHPLLWDADRRLK